MRQAAHARRLVLADLSAFLCADEHHRVVGRLECVGEPRAEPRPCAVAVLRGDPEVLALHADVELHRVLARLDPRIWNLPLGARLEVAQEAVAYRRTVEAG